MPYSMLLRKIVADSGYSSKYIVEECEKRNYKIDKSYFSKLLNDKVPPPTEELSRIISDICNVDERQLVLEGYMDKAPKEIKEAFSSIKMITMYSTLRLFQSGIDENVFEKVEEELKKMPISDFIIQLIDNKDLCMQMGDLMFPDDDDDDDIIDTNIKDDDITININQPVGFKMPDNSMFPIIQENAQIMLKFQPKYDDGDIIALKIQDEEDFTVRCAIFQEDKIILKAFNSKEPIKSYEYDKISILGKVNKVITEIQ